jgi:selenocysteine lyase/cysteine desulfurase
VAAALWARGIMVAAGHFYAVRLLEALGLDPASGVVRLSWLHYTSPADIDRLLTALDQAL